MADSLLSATPVWQKSIGASLARLMTELEAGTEDELFQFCQRVMTRSKAEFVPVDTRRLQRSGKVERDKRSSGLIRVRMSYGGGDVFYALIVHERLDVNHPIGSAKYLEIPLMEALPELQGEVIAKIGRRLVGAVG